MQFSSLWRKKFLEISLDVESFLNRVHTGGCKKKRLNGTFFSLSLSFCIKIKCHNKCPNKINICFIKICSKLSSVWDHPFKTSACSRGGGVKNLPNLPTGSTKKIPTIGGSYYYCVYYKFLWNRRYVIPFRRPGK